MVWEKDTADPATGSGIYVYDIGGGDATMILAGPEYRDPDIWGHYVVCVKDVASPAGPNASEIVLYNLDTSESTVVADAGKNNEHPRIDNGRVVWSAGDIWTPDNANTWSTTYRSGCTTSAADSTSTITSDAGGNLNPSIDGGLVAWQTWTPPPSKATRSPRVTRLTSPKAETSPAHLRSTPAASPGRAARPLLRGARVRGDHVPRRAQRSPLLGRHRGCGW